MRVDDAPPRREIEQLERGRRGREQRERSGLPCAAWPVSARFAGKAPHEAERRGERVRDPEQVVGHADGEVERHVVGIVEAREEREVCDVREERERTDGAPEQVWSRAWRGGGRGRGSGEAVAVDGVEVEKADDGVIKTVDDGEGGGEVVELLGAWKICTPGKGR